MKKNVCVCLLETGERRPWIIRKKKWSFEASRGQCGGNRSGESNSSAVTSIIYVTLRFHTNILVVKPLLDFLLEELAECSQGIAAPSARIYLSLSDTMYS